MDGQSDLLSKDKHDQEAIERLRKLQPEQLVPLLPELLEWIADINWPICRDAIELVLTVPEHVAEPVCKVLQTTDEGWKCNCLDYVVRDLPQEEQQRLRPELERIAQNPTLEEIEEETRDTAQEILETIDADVDMLKS
jgi:hypothetical protein